MTDLQPPRGVEELARRIKSLEERLARLARSPQLTRSSIDNGALNVRDGSGQLTGIIGQQWDGTNGYATVAGPVPPTPAGLSAEPVLGGIRYTWDGSYVDPQAGFTSPVVAPQDFTRLEIELSYTADFAVLLPRGSVPSAAGGQWIHVDLTGTEVYARPRVRSNSGKLSPPGATVGPMTARPVESPDIAVGAIDAEHLKALIILASLIVLGPDTTGDHTRLGPDGVEVYAADSVDGIPNLVTVLGRLLGVVDPDGTLLAGIDSTGAINGRTANFREDIVVQGLPLEEHIANAGQPAGAFRDVAPLLYGGNYYGPIRSRVGVAEVNGWLVAGRRYRIAWQCAWAAEQAGDEAAFGMHVTSSSTDTAAAPLVTDPMIEEWVTTDWSTSRWLTAAGNVAYTATTTGRHRFLLSAERGSAGPGSSIVIVADSRFPISMEITDLGPAKPYTGQFSQGGGTFYNGTPPPPPPAPVQHYNTGWMAPAGWRTFRGNGSERFDVPGPVQGWDPSGFNGDGSGFWWWNLPSITGTVDEVWVWLQSDHWYNDTGGTARLAPIRSGAQHPVTSYMVASPYDVAGFPKPGSKQVNISGWKNLFHNNQGANRAIGVSVGPIGSADLNYYGRFDGPSARLLLKFTQ